MIDLRDLDGLLSDALARIEGFPHTEGMQDALHGSLCLLANVLCFFGSQSLNNCEVYSSDAPSEIVAKTRSKRPALRASAKGELLKAGFCKISILDLPPDVKCRPDEATGAEVAAHWRRGHWRRQPHGTGRAEVRLLWIKPTIVRADKGAPERGHLYTVDAP